MLLLVLVLGASCSPAQRSWETDSEVVSPFHLLVLHDSLGEFLIGSTSQGTIGDQAVTFHAFSAQHVFALIPTVPDGKVVVALTFDGRDYAPLTLDVRPLAAIESPRTFVSERLASHIAALDARIQDPADVELVPSFEAARMNLIELADNIGALDEMAVTNVAQLIVANPRLFGAEYTSAQERDFDGLIRDVNELIDDWVDLRLAVLYTNLSRITGDAAGVAAGREAIDAKRTQIQEDMQKLTEQHVFPGFDEVQSNTDVPGQLSATAQLGGGDDVLAFRSDHDRALQFRGRFRPLAAEDAEHPLAPVRKAVEIFEDAPLVSEEANELLSFPFPPPPPFGSGTTVLTIEGSSLSVDSGMLPDGVSLRSQSNIDDVLVVQFHVSACPVVRIRFPLVIRFDDGNSPPVSTTFDASVGCGCLSSDPVTFPCPSPAEWTYSGSIMYTNPNTGDTREYCQPGGWDGFSIGTMCGEVTESAFDANSCTGSIDVDLVGVCFSQRIDYEVIASSSGDGDELHVTSTFRSLTGCDWIPGQVCVATYLLTP